MRARLAGEWIAQSDDVVLLHEPGRYPVAYFPIAAVRHGALVNEGRQTQHQDLGETGWFAVTAGGKTVNHAAWQHTALPDYAYPLRGRVAFAWRAMDAFYEEDERIVGHAADAYHRWAPACANRRAMPTPMPCPAPVTGKAQLVRDQRLNAAKPIERRVRGGLYCRVKSEHGLWPHNAPWVSRRRSL